MRNVELMVGIAKICTVDRDIYNVLKDSAEFKRASQEVLRKRVAIHARQRLNRNDEDLREEAEGRCRPDRTLPSSLIPPARGPPMDGFARPSSLTSGQG